MTNTLNALTGTSSDSYLVAPLQHIFLAVLHLVVDVEKLDYAVFSDVVSILSGFFPVQWRSL